MIEQRLIRREGVVQRGGLDMLRGEPVIDDPDFVQVGCVPFEVGSVPAIWDEAPDP